MGGLGLRAAQDHSDAAYATSYMASESYRRKLQHLEENEIASILPPNLLETLSTKMGEQDTLSSELKATKMIKTFLRCGSCSAILFTI